MARFSRPAKAGPLEADEAFKKRKASILTVIFGDMDVECEALKPFGPVMKLEDVVEACGGA